MRCSVLRLDHKNIIVPIPSVSASRSGPRHLREVVLWRVRRSIREKVHVKLNAGDIQDASEPVIYSLPVEKIQRKLVAGLLGECR